MRALALLVFACGCRVATPASVEPADANPPRGDGLPDRIVTDGAAWSDLRIPVADALGDLAAFDVQRDGAGGSFEGQGDAGDGGGGAEGDALGPDQQCSLIGPATCPGAEGCYPYPFEAFAPAATRCAFQGVGGASVPCQSQVECDGTTICSAPGRSDSFCLQRCSLTNPRCPTASVCTPFGQYAGVGVCL